MLPLTMIVCPNMTPSATNHLNELLPRREFFFLRKKGLYRAIRVSTQSPGIRETQPNGVVFGHEKMHFRTPVPFWGQIAYNLSALSPIMGVRC